MITIQELETRLFLQSFNTLLSKRRYKEKRKWKKIKKKKKVIKGEINKEKEEIKSEIRKWCGERLIER